jgi:hypothetical protein
MEEIRIFPARVEISKGALRVRDESKLHRLVFGPLKILGPFNLRQIGLSAPFRTVANTAIYSNVSRIFLTR